VKLIAISHNDETKMCVVIVITNNPVNLLVQESLSSLAYSTSLSRRTT
jgi:hypothetical protein